MDESKTLGTEREGMSLRLVADLVNRFGSEHADVTPDDSNALAGIGDWVSQIQLRTDPRNVVLSGGWTPAGGRDVQERIASRYRLAERPPIATGIAAFLGGLRWSSAPEQRFFDWGGFDDFESLMLEPEDLPEGTDGLGDASPRPTARAASRAARRGRGQASVQARSKMSGAVARLSAAPSPSGAPMAVGNRFGDELLAPEESRRTASAGATPVVLDGISLSPRALPALTAALAWVSEVFHGPAEATSRRFSPAAFSAALKVVSLAPADAPSLRLHGTQPNATVAPGSQAATPGASPRSVGLYRGLKLGTVVPGAGTGDPTSGTPENRIPAMAREPQVPAPVAADQTMRLGRYGFARDFSLTPAEAFSSSIMLRASDEAPEAGPDAFLPGVGYVQPAGTGALSTALVGDNDIVYVSLDDLSPTAQGGSGEAEASLRVPTGQRAFARLPATVRERLSSHAMTVTEAVRLQQALARLASAPAGGQARALHAQRAAAARAASATQGAFGTTTQAPDGLAVRAPRFLPAALRNVVAARTLPGDARFAASDAEPARPGQVGQPSAAVRSAQLATQVRALRAALQPRTLRVPMVASDAPAETPGSGPRVRPRVASIDSWIRGLATTPGAGSGTSPMVGLAGSLASAEDQAGPRLLRSGLDAVGRGSVVPAGLLDGESFSWSGFDFLAPQAEESVIRDEQRVVAAALAAAAGASPTAAQRAARRSTTERPRVSPANRGASALAEPATRALRPATSVVGGGATASAPTLSGALAGLTGIRPAIAAGIRVPATFGEIGRTSRTVGPAGAQAPRRTGRVAPVEETGRFAEAVSSVLASETPELAAYSYLPRLVAHLGVRQAAAMLPALGTPEARRTLIAQTPEQIARLVGPERNYAEGWLASAVALTREWLRAGGSEGPVAPPEGLRGVESRAIAAPQRRAATAVGTTVPVDASPRLASAEAGTRAVAGPDPESTGRPAGHAPARRASTSERGRYWGGFAPLRSPGGSAVADVLRPEALATALASRHGAALGESRPASPPWDRAWASDLLTLVELEEALRTGSPGGPAETAGLPAAEARVGRADGRAAVESGGPALAPVGRPTAVDATIGGAAFGAVELGRALTAARQVQDRSGAAAPVVQRVAASLLGRETVGLRLATGVDRGMGVSGAADDVAALGETRPRLLGRVAFGSLAERLERSWSVAAGPGTSLTGLPDGTAEEFWAEAGTLVLSESSEAEASSGAGIETGGVPTAVQTRAAAQRVARAGRLDVSRGGAADRPLTAIERVAARRLAAAASGALRRQPQAGSAEAGRPATAYPSLMAILADRPDVAAGVLRAVGGQADTAAQLLRLEPARLPRAVRDALTQAGVDWAAAAPVGGGAVAGEATRRANAGVLDIETMIALALADTTGGVGDPVKSGLAERALGEVPAAWAHANEAMVQRLVERLTRSRAVRPLDIGFADMEPVVGDAAATSTAVPEAGSGGALVQPVAAQAASDSQPARRTSRDVVAPEGPGAPMTAALDAVDMSPVTWDLIQTRLSSAPVSHARPANVSGVAQAMLSNRVLTRSTLPLVAPAVAQVAAQAQLSATGGPTADAQPTQTQAAAGEGAGAGLEKQPKLDMERIAKEIASRISLRARRENDRRGTWL